MSLLDLLEKHNAPKVIDYISIDTEGSEFEILNSFDFSRYKFNALTIENNYTSARQKISNILTENCYIRIFENISKWDDWYIRDL
ncbi:FkbM family methyltransferase [Rhizobium sp. PAMB 3182]